MSGFELRDVVMRQLQAEGKPSVSPAGCQLPYEGSQERDIEDTRSNEEILNNIRRKKQVGGEAALSIGRDLIEMKRRLSHGEWLPWLEKQAEFSVSSANRLMKLAREWTNPSALTNLGATKAFTLLALPPEERETFMAEHNVVDMTSRELEKAIRERDEARLEAEAAQADARSAEESRAKMEADMKVLEETHRSAQEGEAQARDALAKAQAELQELRDRPVEVAVETVVDQEAIKKARADAIAEMQKKLAEAEAARKAAEKKRETAEKALAAAAEKAGANAAILSRAEKAEAELAEARRQLEAAAKAEKTAAVNADPDLALFNVLLVQEQENLNKMHGIRLKVGPRDDDVDDALKKAFNALSDFARRCAE